MAHEAEEGVVTSREVTFDIIPCPGVVVGVAEKVKRIGQKRAVKKPKESDKNSPKMFDHLTVKE